MLTSLGFYIPDSSHLAGLAAVLLWCLAFVVLGAFALGRERLPELDLACGFGLASLIITGLGVASSVPFTFIAYGLLALSAALAIVVLRRNRRLVEAGAIKVMILGAPLLVLVADMSPSQWDEFTTWLPNARFLFDHDGFPNAESRNVLSSLPAYPYGIPTVIYLTSRVAGRFVENAAALFNVVLLMCLALAVAKLVATALRTGDGDRLTSLAGDGFTVRPGWAVCAVGILAVTALNPTFVRKLVFTAYSDPGTAVLLGLGGVAVLHLLDAAAGSDGRTVRRVAWQFGLIAAALINVRQANLVLFVALVAGTLLAGWRDPRIALADIVRPLLLPMLLPVAIYLAWRYHVTENFTAGEFAIRPIAEWRLDLAVDVFARMALIASKKGGYFAVMLIAVILAVRAMGRARRPLDHLAIVMAVVFVAYNGFLLFAYLTAFTEYEALRAASYWRYNTHLGGLCVVFAAYGLARIWRARAPSRMADKLGWAAIALTIAMPIAFAKKIRFDAVPAKRHVRAVGEELARTLTSGDRLAIVDDGHNGEYAVILRYALSGAVLIAVNITAFQQRSAEDLRRLIEDRKATHVWIYEATAKARKIVGVPLARGASYLLERGPDSGWRIARSWRYDEDRPPTASAE